MSKLRVCHIPNWYPNKWNHKEAIWTKRHIESLDEHVINDVFHVEVRTGKFGFHFDTISDREKSFVITTRIKIWFVRELLTTLLLVYVLLFKIRRKNYDVFNFHITYPLLTYSRFIGFFVRKPIVVTDHWSAYHMNFGVEKRLKRIERIFHNKRLNFICVSKSLENDINKFARTEIRATLVPNLVDTDVFHFKHQDRIRNQLFVLSYWKSPKDPFLILEAIKQLNQELEEKLRLVVGGFGPLIPEMEVFIKENELENVVSLTGKLNGDEIAEYLNQSSAFLHASDYEVASVVCMEAISCGCPVVASNVGGITEYLKDSNGVLVPTNDVEDWKSAIKQVLSTDYNSIQIAAEAKEIFDSKKVGEKYYEALKKYVSDNRS